MELLTRILWLLPLIIPIWTSKTDRELGGIEDYSDQTISATKHLQHEDYKPSLMKRDAHRHNIATLTDRKEDKVEENGDKNNNFPSTIRFSSKEELKEYLLNQSGSSPSEKFTQKVHSNFNKDVSTNVEMETHEELSYEKDSDSDEKLKTKTLYKHKTDEVKYNTSAIEERESYRLPVPEDYPHSNLPELSEVPLTGKITHIKVSVEYSNSSEAPSLELIRDDSGLFFLSGEVVDEKIKGVDLDDYIDIKTSKAYPEYGLHLLNLTEPLYENEKSLVEVNNPETVNSTPFNSREGIETIIDFSPKRTTNAFRSKKPNVSKSKLKLLMDKPKKIMTIIKAYGVDQYEPESVTGILVPTDDGKEEVFVSDNILAGSAFLLETLQQQQGHDDFADVASPHEEYLTSESRIIESSPVPMKGMPYQFGWIVDDEATANFQTRQEKGDNNGVVTGCYQVLEPTGLVRTVQYIADDGGFRILSLTNGPDKTPCPGLEEAGRLSQASANGGKTFERPKQTLPRPTAPPPPPTRRPSIAQPPLSANYNFQKSSSSSSSNYSSSNYSESNSFNLVSNGYNYPRPTTLPPPPPYSPTPAYRPPSPSPPITTTYRPPPTTTPTYTPTTPYVPPPPPPSTIAYPSSTYRPPRRPSPTYSTPQPRPRPTYTTPQSNPRPTYTTPQPRPRPTYTTPQPRPRPTYTTPQPRPTYTTPQPRPKPTYTPEPPRPSSTYLPPPPPTSYQPSTRPPPPVRVPITTSPPVSSAASLSQYNLEGSAQQAWMAEYLENITQQIYGSYSNSSTDTSYFGSQNKINFPFVLIPITTFLDLQRKGALEGNIQTFGAYVQPPLLKPKTVKPAQPSLSYLPPVSGGKAVHKTTTNVYNTTQTKVQQVKHRQEGINSVTYQVTGVQEQTPQVTQQFSNQYKSQESSVGAQESSSSSSTKNVQYNTNRGQHLSQQQQNQKQSKASSSSSNSKSSSLNILGNIQSSYLPPYPSKPSITFPDSPPVSLNYGTPRAEQIPGAIQNSYQSQQFSKSNHNEENSSSNSKNINYSIAGNQQQISQQYNHQQSSEASNEETSSSSSLIQSSFGDIQSGYLPPKPSFSIESAYLPPKQSRTLESAYLPPHQQVSDTTVLPALKLGNILLDLPSARYSAPAPSVSYSQQSSNSNENQQSSSSNSQVSGNISGNSKSYSAESTSSDSSKSAESSKSSSQYSLNNSNSKIHKASSSSNSATKSTSQKSYSFNSGVVQENIPPIVSSPQPTYSSGPPTPAPYVNPALSYLPPVNANPVPPPKTPAPYVNPSLSYLPPVNSNSPAVPIAQFSYQLPHESSGDKTIKNYELAPPSPDAEPTHSDSQWEPFSPNYAIYATPTPKTIRNYSLQSSSSESSNEESSSQQSQQYVGSLQSAIPGAVSQPGSKTNGYNYSSSSSQISSNSSNSQVSNNQQYSGTWTGSNNPPQFIQFPAFAPPKTPQIPDVDPAQLEVRTWNSQNYGR